MNNTLFLELLSFPKQTVDESSLALSFHCPFCDSLRVLIFVFTIRSVYLGAYFYFTKHFESTGFLFFLFFFFLIGSLAAEKQQRTF